jgi:hypothetical protein
MVRAKFDKLLQLLAHFLKIVSRSRSVRPNSGVEGLQAVSTVLSLSAAFPAMLRELNPPDPPMRHYRGFQFRED